MKNKRLSRRGFFKLSAFGTGSAALAAVVGLPAQLAQAHVGNGLTLEAPPTLTPDRVHQSISDIAATPLPSALPLGAPLADISKNWDGTVTGIDTNGVPHIFDPITRKWNILGAGFDVIARRSDTDSLVVRGNEVYFDEIPSGKPQALSDTWQNLPDTFAQGLDGAAMAANVLYLFRSGRYVFIDSATNTASVPVAVNTFANWPTTDHWQQGVIDAVGAHANDVENPYVMLWSKGEYVFVDMAQKAVTFGPQPLTYFVQGQMLAAMQEGFNTLLWSYDANKYTVQAFNGPVRWGSINTDGTASPSYVGAYYDGWAPTLSQAPQGRVGELWAAGPLTEGYTYRIYYHDGSNWQAAPQAGLKGATRALSAGADGTVWALGANTQPELNQFSSTSNMWTTVATAPATAVQLAVGDANRVWVRDNSNQAYRYNNNGGFSAVNLGHPATDIAAGSDGTLWHAAGDDHIYRYLPEGTAPSKSLAPGLPAGAVINHIAGTGFGDAYLLADDTAQLYLYDTPFVFKTSAAYYPGNNSTQLRQTVSNAGHTLFVSSVSIDSTTAGSVAALDAQTGAERWRVPLTRDNNNGIQNFYDPALKLVYVVNDADVTALNPDTGTQVWHLDASTSLPANDASVNASLLGNQLCIGTISGRLLLIDVADALWRAQQNQPPQVRWTTIIESAQGLGDLYAMGVPAAEGAYIYIVSNQLGDGLNRPRHISALSVDTGAIVWQKPFELPGRPGGFADADLWWDIVIGNTQTPNTPTTTPALFVNGVNGVVALNPADGTTLSKYLLPQSGDNPPSISSPMAYQADRLYFGDTLGTVYVLDALSMTLTTKTSDASQSYWQGVRSAPVLIASQNPDDGVVVCFTRGDSRDSQSFDQYVYLFDPATGNLDQIQTDLTKPGTLVYDDTHGVLYAMAWPKLPGNGVDPQLGQLFAIRPDTFIQDERAFIIESQLMQDFDEPTDGVSDPTPNARYQTHVSLVDGNNTALPNVSVKIWPDEVTTLSIDGGAPVTLDPDDPDPNKRYVAFQADGSGSFTIHTGSLVSDGKGGYTDAADLTATTLRVWAAFMDEDERIVINPDAEFHSRVATTQAVAQDPDADHPNQVNLQNAQDYPTYQNGVQQAGTALFTDDEKSSGTPGQAATAIQNTTSAVGVQSTTSSAQIRTAWLRKTSDAPGRYTPDGYTLPGMVYQPTDTPADRNIAVSATLSFNFINGVHTPLSHTDAASQIDALGDSDLQAMRAQGTFALLRFLSSLKDAWKDIKKAGTQVTHAIVSAAKDVYIGIRYVVGGVVNVVKAVAQDIADAMTAIGSFFVQLGKDIVKVIRAIGAFFNFKHVVATYDVIRGVVDDYLNTLKDNLGSVQTDVDNAFSTAKTDIADNFNKLISAVEGGTPINKQPGAGSTPHSVMTVQPVPPAGVADDDSPGQSQAVQGMWGTHKLKQNRSNATASDGQTTDALSKFATGFYNRLTGDLSGAFSGVTQQFDKTFKATSISEFAEDALGDVLSIFEGVALLSVDVVQAFTDGMFGVAGDLAVALQNSSTIKIPILSTLWKMITGKPLEINLVDVFAFILAIPVTYSYRILSGTWITAPSASATADQPGVGATLKQNILGLLGSYCLILGGVLSALVDAIIVTNKILAVSPIPELKPLGLNWMGQLLGVELLTLGAVQKGIGFLNFANKTGQQKIATECLFAFSVAKLLNAVIAGPLVAKLVSAEAAVFFTTAVNFLISLYSMEYIFYFHLNRPITFVLADVFQQAPSITGWFKLAGPPEGYIAAGADFLFLEAAAGLSLANTIDYWNKTLPTDPTPTPAPSRRLYLPWIANNRADANSPGATRSLPAGGVGRLRALPG